MKSEVLDLDQYPKCVKGQHKFIKGLCCKCLRFSPTAIMLMMSDWIYSLKFFTGI